ncbi:hypothetical protein [Nonomuraea sp. NPDC003804]|uniref:hypothetical protein n=1 Tax=Nonomuraea sp. NPDC003804 TaxID=3154547 RepID=UPI0033BDFEB1
MKIGGIVAGALVLGSGFGAAVSLLNAVSSSYAAIGSRIAGTGWAAAAEVASLLLDSGWAWAGLAVAAGWSATARTAGVRAAARGTATARTAGGPAATHGTDTAGDPAATRGTDTASGPAATRGAGTAGGRAMARGAVAGVLTLIAATAAYYCLDSVLRDEPLSWYWPETVRWWVASVLFGTPLGAVGASIRRPGLAGLLAKLTVPVGAAVQMVVLPPRESDLIATPLVVWAAAAMAIGFSVVWFVRTAARRPTP